MTDSDYIDGDVKEVSNLYSCDKEGNDTIVIANNVCGSDDIFIIDNILYYKAYSTKADADGNDFYGRTYYGGIYKREILQRVNGKRLSVTKKPF